MGQIKSIIVHCSDSPFGNVLLIDKWHKERGFSMIGYHYVVLNGFPSHAHLKHQSRLTFLDGSIESGRFLDDDQVITKEEIGAHAYGFNSESVGICLIGEKGIFTPRQLHSLRMLLNELLKLFNLPVSAVIGHYEINPDKTCPDINMDDLRQYLTDYTKIPLLLLHKGVRNMKRQAIWSKKDMSVYAKNTGEKLAHIQQRGETEFYVRYGEDGHKSHLEPFECEVDAFKFIVKDLNLEIVT